MVSEYSKEVHAVKKVRFEVKLSTYRDGRTLARIYDDYWDSIMEAVLAVYDRVVNPNLLIRRVNIAACNLIAEDDIPEDKPQQLDKIGRAHV